MIFKGTSIVKNLTPIMTEIFNVMVLFLVVAYQNHICVCRAWCVEGNRTPCCLAELCQLAELSESLLLTHIWF